MKAPIKIGVGVATGVTAAFVARWLFGLNKVASAVQIKILSINIKGISQLYLKMQIFNPTKNSIKIDSISGQIFFNNTEIGTIQYFNTAPILPLSYTTFDKILVELTPQGSLILAQQILLKKSGTGTFLITGNTYVKNIGFPFSQTYKVW